MTAPSNSPSKSIMIFSLFFSLSSMAATMRSSITVIPTGTVFTLNEELEIPENKDFILLGGNFLQSLANEWAQVYNEQQAREGPAAKRRDNRIYFPYSAYRDLAYKNFEESYQDCLENNMGFYRKNNRGRLGNNINIHQRNLNTNSNIIINQNGYDDDIGAYLKENDCQKPAFTYSALLIHKKNVVDTRYFRNGHKFQVKSVKVYDHDGYSNIVILFDHKIARGISVVTTLDPDEIKIKQLTNTYSESSSLLASFTEGFQNILNVAGNTFSIKLSKNKKYYD